MKEEKRKGMGEPKQGIAREAEGMGGRVEASVTSPFEKLIREE